MSGLIYCVKNNINGKIYIGQTKYDLKSRKREHINEAKRGGGFYFHKALKKYDYNFTWSILEENIKLEYVDEREKYYIELYDTFNSNNGYNLTSGGDFCFKVKYTKEELDYIISERYSLNGQKRILESFNKEFNREVRNVYSIDKIIKKYIPKEDEKDIKFKIKSKNSKNRVETSASKLNRSKSQIGKEHTDETKEKIRLSKLGSKHTEESKDKVKKNNKRTIRFNVDEINFILESIKNGVSKRKTISNLNNNFGYKINLTSTSVIDRVIKDSENGN